MNSNDYSGSSAPTVGDRDGSVGGDTQDEPDEPQPGKRDTPHNRYGINTHFRPAVIGIAMLFAAYSPGRAAEKEQQPEPDSADTFFLPTAQSEDEDADDSGLTAEILMSRVVAALPRDPLEIKGSFWVRRRRGLPVAEREFAMQVHWGAEPSVAHYRIMDESGRQPIEEMTLTRHRGKPSEWRYRKGSPLVAHDLPDLYASIHETDLSWTDLSLSFLWWPGGRLVGTDRVRGYRCYIVEIPAPSDIEDEHRASEAPYAKVRIWVERKHNMLLQAEGFDAQGRRLRRLWIRSVKKIDERWMVKDMEVQRYPAVHRTKLTIREVNASDEI